MPLEGCICVLGAVRDPMMQCDNVSDLPELIVWLTTREVQRRRLL